MSEEIKKTCIHHGALNITQVIKAGFEYGQQRYKCRLCMKRMHAEHYKANREKVLAKHAIYRKENPEKVRETKRNWFIKAISNRAEYSRKNKEYRKRKRDLLALYDKDKKRKHYRELADYYVRKLMIGRSKLSSKDIPIEAVEACRAILLLKREIKKLQETKTNDEKN